MTSPEPRASDGTFGTVPTPSVFAYDTARSMPTVLEHADRGAIAGRPERGPHRHRVSRGVLILGKPRTLVGLDRLIDTLDERRGRIPVFDRRRIDKRLEGRSGLAFRLQRAVQTNARRIAAADDRPDFTRRRVEREQRCLQRLDGARDDRFPAAARRRGRGHPRFDVTERADDSGLCCLLHVRVDGRVHAEPLLVDGVLSESLDELAPHDLLEVQGGRILAPESVVERHLLGNRRVVLLGRDEPVLAHQPQHHVAALRGAVEIRRGIRGGRRLDDARQHCGFGDRHVRGRFAEIPARGCFCAVQPVAEVDLVQIDFENLILAVHLFDALGEYRLAHFSPQCLVARQKADARELLRNRARALGSPAFANVSEYRADDADAVDAVMSVKARVLDRQYGIPQMRRDATEFDFHAVLTRNGKYWSIVGVVHRGPFGRFAYLAQLVCAGKACNHLIQEPSCEQDNENRGRRQAANGVRVLQRKIACALLPRPQLSAEPIDRSGRPVPSRIRIGHFGRMFSH